MLPSQTSTPATPFTPTFVQSSQAGRTVELERVIIDDEMILVQSSATCWVNARSLNVDLEGLSKRYADVVKLAKSAGAKLTYRYKTKKSIQEVLATGAVEQLQTYQRLYGILKTAWEKKVIDGISSPASDDEYYGELSELQNSMEALTYRNTALGRAMSLSCELNEHKQRLSHKIACHGNANGTTIYL